MVTLFFSWSRSFFLSCFLGQDHVFLLVFFVKIMFSFLFSWSTGQDRFSFFYFGAFFLSWSKAYFLTFSLKIFILQILTSGLVDLFLLLTIPESLNDSVVPQGSGSGELEQRNNQPNWRVNTSIHLIIIAEKRNKLVTIKSKEVINEIIYLTVLLINMIVYVHYCLLRNENLVWKTLPIALFTKYFSAVK